MRFTINQGLVLKLFILVLAAPLISACSLVRVCTPDGKDCTTGLGIYRFPCPDGTAVWAGSAAEAAVECSKPPHTRKGETDKVATGVDVQLTSTGAPIVIQSAPAHFTLIAKSGAGAVLEVREFDVVLNGTVMQFLNPATVDAWFEAYQASDPQASLQITASDLIFDAPGTYNNQVVTITGQLRDGGVPVAVSSHSYVYKESVDPTPPQQMY